MPLSHFLLNSCKNQPTRRCQQIALPYYLTLIFLYLPVFTPCYTSHLSDGKHAPTPNRECGSKSPVTCCPCFTFILICLTCFHFFFYICSSLNTQHSCVVMNSNTHCSKCFCVIRQTIKSHLGKNRFSHLCAFHF